MSWRTRGCGASFSGGSVTTFAPNRQEQTMRVDVMQHYGFTQPLSHAGYYETQHHRQLMTDIKSAILEGHLIALCGVIGSGKTVTLRRLQQQLKEDNRVLVSKSLAVEKHRITLRTLLTALFDGHATEKPTRIPTQSEKRERELRDLVKKGKRPVVLFVDEAHALTRHTLTDLKRLLEVVEDGDGKLSIVLAGHPKLGNDLRRPTMEEIGYRRDIFTLEGLAGSQREYLQWLFHACTAGKIAARDVRGLRRDRPVGQQTADAPPNAAASDTRPGSRVSDRRAADFRGHGQHGLLAPVRRLGADFDPPWVPHHRSGATIRCEA